jgi:hypothetical protein
VFLVRSSTTKLPAAPLPCWVTALVAVVEAVHRCTTVAPPLVALDGPPERVPVLDDLPLVPAGVEEPTPDEDEDEDDDDDDDDPDLLVTVPDVPEPPLPAQAARASPVVATRASPATCRRAECPVVPMTFLLSFPSPFRRRGRRRGWLVGPDATRAPRWGRLAAGGGR